MRVRGIFIGLLIGALFLVVGQGTATWEPLPLAPFTGGYGEALAGTGQQVCMVKQLYATSIAAWACYSLQTGQWQTLPSLQGPDVRNGTALAWDGWYIYVLAGARYEDFDRRLFYRVDTQAGHIDRLADTLGPQGAGDALVYSPTDGKLYAFTGSSRHRPRYFAEYDRNLNEWKPLTYPGWECTDDGASLLAVDTYLFALQGECDEKERQGNFARYDIDRDAWEPRASLPATDCGVGDGATLVWVPETPDYIYATDGGCVSPEYPGWGFWRYSMSKDEWRPFGQLPCPIGYYNGARLAYAMGGIYFWQGSPASERWTCADGSRSGTGQRFYRWIVSSNVP